MRAIVAVAIMLLPGVGLAQVNPPPAALHDKAWYAAHSAARNATLKWCHADATRADWFDCQNAEAAAAGTIGQPQRNTAIPSDPPYFANGNDWMMSPEYWADHSFARAGILVQCARRAPGDQMMLRACPAAQAGEALARARGQH